MVALALTMVRRKVARQWRKVKRQQRLDAGDSSRTSAPAWTDLLRSKEADPASAAAHDSIVGQIFGRLTSQERELIELRLEGYSTAEAARQIGVDPDVLRVQLSRLRKRLRDSGVNTDLL